MTRLLGLAFAVSVFAATATATATAQVPSIGADGKPVMLPDDPAEGADELDAGYDPRAPGRGDLEEDRRGVSEGRL